MILILAIVSAASEVMTVYQVTHESTNSRESPTPKTSERSSNSLWSRFL